MDESWAWDGSLISLTASYPSSRASSNPSPPIRSRVASTHSLTSSVEGPRPLDVVGLPSPSTPEPDLLVTTPTAPPRAIVRSERTPPPPPLPIFSSIPLSPTTPSEAHDTSTHPSSPPFATFLHAEHSFGLSPPNSPTHSDPSSATGSRGRDGSSAASSARRGRGKGRSRAGSVSSTASTDGSARAGAAESLASGEMSSGGEDDYHHAAAGGLVMPSLHLGGASAPPATRNASGEAKTPEGKRPKMLVLGKTAEERRTLATLLAVDEDASKSHSGSSDTGVTDMSYSFLSTRPSQRSSSHSRSVAAASPPECDVSSAFELLLPACSDNATHAPAFVELSHPTPSFEIDIARITQELARPLNMLEAKLVPTYPATTGLAALVEQAGCGMFDAAFFLFSSPPTHAEISVARPFSHLIPLYPVLLLPPFPTGKPQKTSALEQAVKDQLDKAGLRWLPAIRVSCRERGNGNKSDGLYMLPHDLFVHHPPHASPFTGPPSAPSSGSGSALPTAHSTQASSPSSEGLPVSSLHSKPISLASSQELPPPPLSPAYTAASFSSPRSDSGSRSLSLSSRGGSSSSRSSSRGHSRRHARGGSRDEEYSNSLASLYRLQALLHSPDAPGELRKARVQQFLEWREVELAARGVIPLEVTSLPKEWGEKEVEAAGGRRDIDFSRRVAERRVALAGSYEPALRLSKDDDGDVLSSSESEPDEYDREDEDADEIGRAGGTARKSFSFSTSSLDPTTPRVAHRPLAPFSDSSGSGNGNEDLSSCGYFPAFPPPPPSFALPLDASVASLTSTSSTKSGSEMTASSIFLLSAAASDPFHLPSLLHLVGLNLRLAVFSPSFAASLPVSPSPPSAASNRLDLPTKERKKRRAGWGWARTAALVGVVFAAGVAVGVTAAAAADAEAGGLGRWVGISRA